MPEDQRQRAGVGGALIQDEGVVAVQGLTGYGLGRRIESSVRNWVKGARRSLDRTADGKATLLRQRDGPARRGGAAAGAGSKQQTQQ